MASDRGLPRAILCALLILLIVAGNAAAHLPGARPILQRSQFERTVGLEPGGVTLGADLYVTADPLRHTVTHRVDPRNMSFEVTYREDASRPERFFFRWDLERIVEYRDVNVDGRYQPEVDSLVRAWRFAHYPWPEGDIQRARVADVDADSISWSVELAGAPEISLQLAIAGKDFRDEGAVVRPQDVAIYLDVRHLPERAIGSLFAIEGSVLTSGPSRLTFHTVENTSTALLADEAMRRGLLTWGGEAVVDGREQRIDATLDGERQTDAGHRAARFALHFPVADHDLRLVITSGIEYATENPRTPFPWILAVAAVALAARLRKR